MPTDDLTARARQLAFAADADPDAPIPPDPDPEPAPSPPASVDDLAHREAATALDTPTVPLRAGASRSEVDAANVAAGQAGSARRMALATFRHAGPHGLTDYELAVKLNAIPNRIATRRKELADAGLVEPAPARRPTPAGIMAQVHRITPLGVDVANQPAPSR